MHEQGCPLCDIVHQAFPLPTTASPTISGALKDGVFVVVVFCGAVVVCGMPLISKLPSLDCCQKKFLWARKEVDIAQYSIIGLVIQVEDAEKFPQALFYCESLDPFLIIIIISINIIIIIIIIIIIYPLIARVFGAPQMISQPVFSIFPCSPLPSGTCRTPGLSTP